MSSNPVQKTQVTPQLEPESLCKFSIETAKAEIDKMLKWYFFDIDEIKDAKEKSALQRSIDKLVQGVRLGFLEVKTEEKFQVIQHLKNGKTDVVYDEIGGENKSAMDGIAAENHYARMYALLGSLSGDGAQAIKKLKGIDNAIAESLGAIFLLCV